MRAVSNSSIAQKERRSLTKIYIKNVSSEERQLHILIILNLDYVFG